MYHQPIAPPRPEPLDLTPYPRDDEIAPSRHPMSQPAPDGWLRDLVLHARRPNVRDRLQVAIYVTIGLLVALIASGYLRAALGHRL